MLAGLNHFWNPSVYLAIMPSWLSFHEELVFISGILEILGGAALCWRPTRLLAAWGLIALLIAVFPANIEMAQDFYKNQSQYLWVAIARLPLQILLVWWAYDAVRIAQGDREKV